MNFYEFTKILESKDDPAGLWRANSKLIRTAYLSGFPNAEQLATLSWDQLPQEAKDLATKNMYGRSPFKEK